MNKGEKYIVAGSRPWNRSVFNKTISEYPGTWWFIGSKEEFTREAVEEFNPRYIFFLHWSWIVPTEILERYECVCFHMADVPYGRGGSPLQNLISRGKRETKMSALRMVRELDAGPVYLKKPLCLEGSAEEIYIRATELSTDMIKGIIEEHPIAKPQVGEPVTFRRRRPAESRIGSLSSLHDLFDFIRMLDAEGYPKAFLEHEGFRFRFSRAGLYDGRIMADVAIERIEGNES